VHNYIMIYGYARVSADGQSVAAQVELLTEAGAGRVFREVASGAKTDRPQLHRLMGLLDDGDVVMVTRLDRLARSTRDLLNTLASIAGKKAGFKSLGDTWADTTTSHGRLMLTILGGLAEFERELIRSRTMFVIVHVEKPRVSGGGISEPLTSRPKAVRGPTASRVICRS
jgi:DNA invertase Pin-like site-specific DNA recombinase